MQLVFAASGRSGTLTTMDQTGVYLTANLIIKRHGAEAQNRAIGMALQRRERGHHAGQSVWERIFDAITVLEADRPGHGAAVH